MKTTFAKSSKKHCKTPVCIYIVHHPECKEAEVLSGRLYDWFRLGYLSGDSSGAGLPVFFRRQIKQKAEDSPWKIYPVIQEEDATVNVVIVLVDHRMVVDEKWRSAILSLSNQVSEMKLNSQKSKSGFSNRSPMEILPAALHDSFYRTGPLSSNFNSVRLAGFPQDKQEALLRRAATEMTGRLLRSANNSDFKQLDVFLSHAKKDGRIIAETLRDGIQQFGQLEPWFDANDLEWGERWEDAIKSSVTNTAAMVAVVTDAYPTRPWCRAEARIARTPRRLKTLRPKRDELVWCVQPMVAVHSPGMTWTRAIPMLEGVPRIGWPASPSTNPTEYIVDRLVLETMLAQVHREVATDLNIADQDRKRVCFITWVPDSWSLSRLRAVMDEDELRVEDHSRPSAKIEKIIYPGYGLTSSEENDLKPAIHSFTVSTELVSYEDYWLYCEGKEFPKLEKYEQCLLIALSSDGTPIELAEFGVGTEHCDELMVRLAMKLLNQNQRLAFAGILVEGPSVLNEVPIENPKTKPAKMALAEHLVSATLNWQSENREIREQKKKNQQATSKEDDLTYITKPDDWPLVNYTAWPGYTNLTPEAKASLVGLCDIRNVRPAGYSDAEMVRFSTARNGDRLADPQARRIHADALSERCKLSASQCDLRVVWGGQIKESPGWMPGILEEVYQTLAYRDPSDPGFRKPLLIFGEFGGCAGKLAEFLIKRDAVWPPELMPTSDPDRDCLLTELERTSQQRVFEEGKKALIEFRRLLWEKKDAPESPHSDVDPTCKKLHGIDAEIIWTALTEARPRNAAWLVMKAAEDVLEYRRKKTAASASPAIPQVPVIKKTPTGRKRPKRA